MHWEVHKLYCRNNIFTWKLKISQIFHLNFCPSHVLHTYMLIFLGYQCEHKPDSPLTIGIYCLFEYPDVSDARTKCSNLL